MEDDTVVEKSTLLRYNKPVVVAKWTELPEPPIIPQSPNLHRENLQSGRSKIDLSQLNVDKNQSIEDVINCIFPPKEWEENGKHWIQTVSSEPVTKQSVNELWEQLDSALRQKDARETGICPKRRELFDQCFDELLRQEAIYCCERGLLLKLIRDNLRMEMNTFERLYESSIAYGLRKTLLVEEEKTSNKESIATEKEREAALQQEIKELNEKIERIESDESEQRLVSEEEHNREVELLKQENITLKVQLEKAIYPKK